MHQLFNTLNLGQWWATALQAGVWIEKPKQWVQRGTGVVAVSLDSWIWDATVKAAAKVCLHALPECPKMV